MYTNLFTQKSSLTNHMWFFQYRNLDWLNIQYYFRTEVHIALIYMILFTLKSRLNMWLLQAQECILTKHIILFTQKSRLTKHITLANTEVHIDYTQVTGMRRQRSLLTLLLLLLCLASLHFISWFVPSWALLVYLFVCLFVCFFVCLYSFGLCLFC